MARRDQDTVLFDHEGAECRDSRYHRHCSGRWRGVIDLGRDGTGKRVRRKVSGRTKSAVISRLKEVHDELDQGVKSKAGYTVQKCVVKLGYLHHIAWEWRLASGFAWRVEGRASASCLTLRQRDSDSQDEADRDAACAQVRQNRSV